MEAYCLCGEERRMKPIGSRNHALAGILYYACESCGVRIKITQAWEDSTQALEKYSK